MADNKGTAFFQYMRFSRISKPNLHYVTWSFVPSILIAVVNRFFPEEMIQDTMFRNSCLVTSERSVENVGLKS